MMCVWDNYNQVNDELRRSFLCVPPYPCISHNVIAECLNEIHSGKQLHAKISGMVNLPYQRAYQVEYRLKRAKIFEPYIHIIEYATYDAMIGNWICSYISLIPVVESVLRKWAGEIPLNFNKILGFIPPLEEYLRNNLHVFNDDRNHIVNEYIEFLKYMVCDVLFLDFDSYEQTFGAADIFNRNLALHKLEGIEDLGAGLLNKTRMFLLIDIIAELYLMQKPEELVNITLYADMDNDIDFQLRWNLYLKASISSFVSSDLNVIQNAFIDIVTEADKKKCLNGIKAEISKLHTRC